jgi:hypothetical protein
MLLRFGPVALRVLTAIAAFAAIDDNARAYSESGAPSTTGTPTSAP